MVLESELDNRGYEIDQATRTIRDLENKVEVIKTQYMNDDEFKEEILDLKQQVCNFESENERLRKECTLHEREKQSYSQKVDVMEQTIAALKDKNLQLSKLLDERVYNICGELQKRENYLLTEGIMNNNIPNNLHKKYGYKNNNEYQMNQSVGGRSGTPTHSKSPVNNRTEKDRELDFFNKIENFEKREATRRYDREYTPPITAIVSNLEDYGVEDGNFFV